MKKIVLAFLLIANAHAIDSLVSPPESVNIIAETEAVSN